MRADATGRVPTVDLSRLLAGGRRIFDADPSDVAAVLADEVRSLVGADSVVVRTVGDDSPPADVVSGDHCVPDVIGLDIDPDGGPARLALVTGRCERSDDLGTDPRFDPTTCTVHRNGSALAAPLTCADRVLAVVAAYTVRPGGFSTADEHLLDLFARLAGSRLASVQTADLRADLDSVERRMRSAQRSASFAWWEVDLHTGRSQWSEEMYDLFGFAFDGPERTVDDFLGAVHPEDRATLADDEPATILEDLQSRVLRIVRPDGTTRNIQAWAYMEHGEDGRPTRVYGTTMDVTEREQAARARATGERMFRIAFDNAPTGMLITALGGADEGVVLRANAAVCRLLGIHEADAVGRNVLDWIHPDDRAAHEEMRRGLETGERQEVPVERRFVGADGTVRHVLLSSAAFEDRDLEEPYALTHVLDVTDSLLQRAELERLARTDTLTGLQNRSVVETRVARALARLNSSRRGSGDGVALLMLDLDRFKLINDTLGHGAGDTLLVEVATRLRATVREPATVARLGGDEFLVLLENVPDVTTAETVAARIVDRLQQPVRLRSGRKIVCTTSVGVAVATTPGHSSEDLLREADLALYRAKDGGRNGYAVFDRELRTSADRRTRTENRLRRALAHSGLVLYLQPIVALDDPTRPVRGHEALVRVCDPERGLLLPLPFIEVAEETGLMIEVDFWVLEEAVRLLGKDPQGTARPYVSVNVSGRTLEHQDFPGMVERMLAEYGVDGSRLHLEITERALLEATPTVEGAVRDLRALGLAVGLDDFGTGYSALQHLRRLDLDFLKIDSSFITTLGTDDNAAAVVRAVIDLAHAFGLRVIAEGVEDEGQARALHGMGCDTGQGFHLGAPTPADGAHSC